MIRGIYNFFGKESKKAAPAAVSREGVGTFTIVLYKSSKGEIKYDISEIQLQEHIPNIRGIVKQVYEKLERGVLSEEVCSVVSATAKTDGSLKEGFCVLLKVCAEIFKNSNGSFETMVDVSKPKENPLPTEKDIRRAMSAALRAGLDEVVRQYEENWRDDGIDLFEIRLKLRYDPKEAKRNNLEYPLYVQSETSVDNSHYGIMKRWLRGSKKKGIFEEEKACLGEWFSESAEEAVCEMFEQMAEENPKEVGRTECGSAVGGTSDNSDEEPSR